MLAWENCQPWVSDFGYASLVGVGLLPCAEIIALQHWLLVLPLLRCMRGRGVGCGLHQRQLCACIRQGYVRCNTLQAVLLAVDILLTGA